MVHSFKKLIITFFQIMQYDFILKQYNIHRNYLMNNNKTIGAMLFNKKLMIK